MAAALARTASPPPRMDPLRAEAEALNKFRRRSERATRKKVEAPEPGAEASDDTASGAESDDDNDSFLDRSRTLSIFQSDFGDSHSLACAGESDLELETLDPPPKRVKTGDLPDGTMLAIHELAAAHFDRVQRSRRSSSIASQPKRKAGLKSKAASKRTVPPNSKPLSRARPNRPSQILQHPTEAIYVEVGSDGSERIVEQPSEDASFTMCLMPKSYVLHPETKNYWICMNHNCRDRSFAQRDHARSHVGTHYGDQGWKAKECTLCHLLFSDKYNLERHCRNIHGAA